MSLLLGVCAKHFSYIEMLLLGIIVWLGPTSISVSALAFWHHHWYTIYRYYAAALPSILNVFSTQSYLILNSIIGGQALAAVSNKLNDTLGIVIIALISFAVGFWDLYLNKYLLAEIFNPPILLFFFFWAGYPLRIQVYTLVHIYFPLVSSVVLNLKNFNRFENLVWIPNVIVFPVLFGLAGRYLNPSTFLPLPPTSAAQIMSFGSVVAAANISWCTLTPDCGVYHDAEASTWVLLLYIGVRKVLINDFHSLVLHFVVTLIILRP